MTHDDSHDKKGSGVAAAIGAVVVGAAVGAAAAYLSDKDKRENLVNKAKDAGDTVKMKATEVVGSVADKTGEALEKAGKNVKSVKGSEATLVDEVVDTASETIF